MRRVRSVFIIALILAQVIPFAVADHGPVVYGTDRLCLKGDGRHIVVACTVEERVKGRAEVPAAVPEHRVGFGLDSQGLIAPVPNADVPLARVGVAGVRPYALLLEHHANSAQTSDPILEHLELVESEDKILVFDTLESSGVHFRLACGWDLTQTERACAFYDPESDAETRVAREYRDIALQEGYVAAAASFSEVLRGSAPDASVDFKVRRVSVDAEVTPEVMDGGVLDEEVVASEGAFWPAFDEDDEPFVFEPLAWTRARSRVAVSPSDVDDEPAARDGVSGKNARDFTPASITRTSGGPVVDVSVVIVAAAGSGILAFFIVFLAHRHLTARNALINPTRAAILACIKATPGSTISELSRALGVRHATATYHLRILETMGLVVSERVGNKIHFFGNGSIGRHDERVRRLIPVMGRAQAVVDAVIARKTAPAAVLAKDVGMTVPGAVWHLKRLESLGVITRIVVGTRVTFTLAPAFMRD